tara:strand:+ start:832 stop:1113 length:282 start_codon:yes stop_codon:yes gene_type:complete
MRLFFIDPVSSDRLKVRSNSPILLSMAFGLANGIGMERVGMLRFWCHIVKHAVRWKQLKGRFIGENELPTDLVQPILDEIEKAEKRDQSPESN